MESQYAAPELAILDTADRIGRVAYLWLRQCAVSHDASPPDTLCDHERHAQLLAAGFISKLCDTLQLTPHHGLLAAYAYALLDGRDSNSMEIATILFDFRQARHTSNVFEEGRSMAGEMLGLLENSGYSSQPENSFVWPATLFSC